MHRARAQRAKAQGVEGDVEGNQPVLGSIQHEILAKTRARERAEREEQE